MRVNLRRLKEEELLEGEEVRSHTPERWRITRKVVLAP